MNEELQLILMMVGYFGLVELLIWSLFKLILIDWKKWKEERAKRKKKKNISPCV